MMAWVLDTHYSHLFHRVDFVEKSFIVPKAMEASLTPLMESIESRFAGIKVFSLPSVGDPSRSGVFAQRHIELGVKGSGDLVDQALAELKLGVLSFGLEIHEFP
jgi:molybdopterin-biosynthesis enzyme MoeA-like protein